MKTVKPFRLGVLTRPYRWRSRDTLGVAVVAMATLDEKPLLMPDQEAWQTMATEIDPGGVLDLGIPKTVPEMLASGHAYTAHQHDKTVAAVRIRVGGIDKSLTVFGERYRLDNRVTPPQPFESMRIDWSHAYGGAAVAENPLGMGSEDEIVNGLRVRRLAHVELPGRGAGAPGQPAAPAGFGALQPHWPQRMALIGRNHDEAWLHNEFPGFASDMDWRYFNAAPPDQRWTGAQEVPRGAAYEIWNMHPEVPVLAGRLPDWRARCFASFEADGGALQEAALRLTTVWFLPHLRRVVLVWHGNFDIAQDDAADMQYIMPALELAEEPARPLTHYQEVLRRRIDPASAVHVLRDSDLVPRSVFGPWGAAQLRDPLSGPLARNVRAGMLRERERRSVELRAQGLDPELYLPPMGEPDVPADIDDLPEYRERKRQEMAQRREELEARGEAMKAQAGADPQAARQVAERAEDAHRPHRHDLHESLRDFRRTERRARNAQDTTGEPAQPLFSEPQRRGLVEGLRQGHLHAAHLSAPAPAVPSFRSAKIRRRLAAAPAEARRFVRMNLTGVDLSGMDLRGADFSEALLEDANLEGAQLDDCNFTRAVMARARLGRASLARARLEQANLGAALCEGTMLAGANLARANCQKAVFSGCDLSGAHFDRTRLHESRFHDCDLSGSQWTQTVFMQMRLEKLRFDQARFRQAGWIKCTLAGVSFAGAQLQQCGFMDSRGEEGVDFSGAELVACSVAHEGSFAGAVLRGARLRQCGWRGTVLAGADLSGARMEGCDFSECDLREACLDGLVAGESLFVRADFTGASLRGANLIDANLSKSLLPLADISRANLFRADVSQALIDATTRMDGAYTHNAKVWPARRADTPT